MIGDRNEVESVLSNWQRFPLMVKPMVVKTFTTGLNHQTHLIDSGGKLLVLKLFNRAQPSAIQVQRWASTIRLAPNVVYVSDQYDIALFNYIETATLTNQTISSDTLNSIAIALDTLHTTANGKLVNTIGKFDLFKFCEHYLKIIDKTDHRARQIHSQLTPILNTFTTDKTPWCICHNDLVTENCFVVDANALFIDWEFAQFHNPWFDLAAIIYYLKLDKQQARIFLSSYKRDWDDKVTDPIFIASQCALLWGDMLWHLAMLNESTWPSLTKKYSDLKDLARTFNIEI